ncbi:DUF1631 domain-containing protein [Pseudomonas entomophila]|uniref:DUF1631 domain-containing protein n=1 Tax=Pseudomonas entomophila TaxID=312306 RepID=UPI003EB8CD15
MYKESNVVNLAQAMRPGVRVVEPGLPMLVVQVRDKAALQLHQGLRTLFDIADDTLFELADKAFCDHDRRLILDAMHEIRQQRKHLERTFLDMFHDAFYQIARSRAATWPTRSVDQAWNPPEYRESASVLEAMVERTIARDSQALHHLNVRLHHLLEAPLDMQHNPLGPRCLGDYFLRVVHMLEVSAQVKRVLVKLFDRCVLRDVDLMYAESNQMLMAAGVLGALKSAPRRRAQDGQRVSSVLPANQDDAPTAPEKGVDGTCFLTACGLLAERRGRLSAKAPGSRGAQVIEGHDLLRLLTALQQRVLAPEQSEPLSVVEQLEQSLAHIARRGSLACRLTEHDEAVIDLVGLTFDQFLADPNLPRALKTLIDRVRLPVMKAALLEAGFFDHPGHPARRLIQVIADAGMGWSEEGEASPEGVQVTLEHLVHRLLADFAEDMGLFTAVQNECLARVDEERQRTARLEQRVRDAEEGRLRWLQARQSVQRELNLRLHGRFMPHMVVDMLVTGWSQVLLMAWLKHGERSLPWSKALATMDSLLLSVAPHRQTLARQELLERVPGLLKALREGLAGVAMESTAMSAFFQRLQQLHLRACSQTENDEDAQEALVHVQDEIVLAVPQETACGPLWQPAADDPSLSSVRALRVGHWIVTDDGESNRCKLVVALDEADRLVFTHHAGRKVREWTRAGLAMALRRGEVRLLEDGPVFERAWQRVLTQLRAPSLH